MTGPPPANGRGARPPRAVVGSQVNRDEEMFGAAFDRRVVRRFFAYVRPYRPRLCLGIGALLVFTAAQLAIPLVIRHAIDHAIVPRGGDPGLLAFTAAVFAAVILVNYGANFLQEWLVSRTGEQVIFDLRRAMFAHLQYVAPGLHGQDGSRPHDVAPAGRRVLAAGVSSRTPSRPSAISCCCSASSSSCCGSTSTSVC